MAAPLALSDLLPLLALFAVLFALLAALWQMRDTSAPGAPPPPAAAVPAEAVRPAPAGGVRRRRGGLAHMRAAVGAAEGEGGEGGDGDGAGAADAAGAEDGGRGRRKKDANREAKRAAREAREEALAAQRERLEQQDEARTRERGEEDEREREAAAAAAAAAEERARAEEEEYAEWKGLIEVEDAGDEGGDALADDAALLERFVAHVKGCKIVVLEELAAEFGLKTEDAIQRLTALEENGTLTGVFDDRGKFIYVSPDEMTAVADYISRRGRVSIPELAAESTRLLHLDAAAAAAAL